MTQKTIPFARRMFDLPIVYENEMYPYILEVRYTHTVKEDLYWFKVKGWRIARIAQPHIITGYPDRLYPIDFDYESIEPIGYKLRFAFVMERGDIPTAYFDGDIWREGKPRREREFIKSGFLYDSSEQFDEWLRGTQ